MTITGENTLIDGNSADVGAGLFTAEEFGVDTTALSTLSDATLSNNAAEVDGGGLAIERFGTVLLSNVSIVNNSAVNGGGGIFTNDSGTLTVNANTVIAGNTAGSLGAGIYNTGDRVTSDQQFPSVVVIDSLLDGNTLDSGDQGSAIFNQGTFQINNSCILNSLIFSIVNDPAVENENFTLNATSNWWDSDTGPNPVALSGDIDENGW